MSGINIDDSVFEVLLRQAVIDKFNEEYESIMSDEELAKQCIPSPEFKARIRKLIREDSCS